MLCSGMSISLPSSGTVCLSLEGTRMRRSVRSGLSSTRSFVISYATSIVRQTGRLFRAVAESGGLGRQISRVRSIRIRSISGSVSCSTVCGIVDRLLFPHAGSSGGISLNHAGTLSVGLGSQTGVFGALGIGQCLNLSSSACRSILSCSSCRGFIVSGCYPSPVGFRIGSLLVCISNSCVLLGFQPAEVGIVRGDACGCCLSKRGGGGLLSRGAGGSVGYGLGLPCGSCRNSVGLSHASSGKICLRQNPLVVRRASSVLRSNAHAVGLRGGQAGSVGLGIGEAGGVVGEMGDVGVLGSLAFPCAGGVDGLGLRKAGAVGFMLGAGARSVSRCSELEGRGFGGAGRARLMFQSPGSRDQFGFGNSGTLRLGLSGNSRLFHSCRDRSSFLTVGPGTGNVGFSCGGSCQSTVSVGSQLPSSFFCCSSCSSLCVV
jgi:hypothetical protein